MRLMKGIDLVKFPQGLEVPCGQCMPCRIARREEWSLRLMHESLFWDSCLFITLTYDQEHLPKNGSLVPNDLTKFFKRLRKRIGDRKIKYFACGDYGGKFDRPHYHILLFGLDYLSMDDRQIIKDCWTLCDWDMLGKSPFGDVTPQSIRYVCKYIEDKVIGKESIYAYDKNDILPTYAVMSKGIGRSYAQENYEKIFKELQCDVNGRTYPVPRYYRKILELPKDDLLDYGKDRESKQVESITGVRITRDEAYMSLMPDEVVKIEEEFKRSNRQHDANIRAKIKLNSRK